ncbi:unnamed protein product [Phytophthora lilii]|uniref:Unnamed protein product n=1 Tax=Phytophthora lilii TaxID=2077276 RepID=A0A9W6U227_9STRA|nr:unnamed protein product [Phytophthora lilii]
MMQDGKCLCGWCGNQDHTTGDACCPGLAASKKKLEDRQKKANAKKNKKMVELTAKVQNATDSIHAVMTLNHSGRESLPRKKAIVPTVRPTIATPNYSPAVRQSGGFVNPAPPDCSAPPRLWSPSIKIAAKTMLSIDTSPTAFSNKTETQHLESVAGKSGTTKMEGQELTRPHDASRAGTPSTSINIATHRKLAISDFPRLLKASNSLYAKYQNAPECKNESTLPAIKVEDVRKGAFTEGLADQYKHEMVRKVKRVSSMEQYIGVRSMVLESITAAHEGGDYHEHCRLPRKPKIPKPSRRKVNPKTKQPRPDRFNRKINRIMRKIWRKDHPLPVVEESLRDP